MPFNFPPLCVTVEVRGQASRVIVGGGADPVLGRTRIVVSTFLSPFPGRRQVVAALMLRRPRSLRPQGIINVAVSLLDDAHVPLHDAPDAFALKDLVTMTQRDPRSSSSCNNKIAQGDGHETPMMEDGIQVKKQPAAAFVDHSGRLDPRSAAFEQRKLVQTLEKWKADLSPGRKEDGRRGAWRSLSPAACFRGSGDWGR
ncbi:hypothetical protein PR202_ga03272 [Eleusine coracana subsp. coracana]|uniref:Uncharacterized protein n=1 Tax=Eleusine coracana subsp. coracana TaxID=191504 RepID=A0AAV5BLJ2_ELECO|nr:hypothetical protein PR202_ga03272 [Eleusine coracana subsp. coracana]